MAPAGSAYHSPGSFSGSPGAWISSMRVPSGSVTKIACAFTKVAAMRVPARAVPPSAVSFATVSYTHLTLPTTERV